MSQDCLSLFILQGSKSVAGGLSLSTVPEDNLVQVGAAPIMTQSDLAAHAPERSREEFLLDGAIPIALVKIRAKVVAFEVGVDILHREWLELRLLESGEAAAVIHSVDERCRGGEKVIEDAARRIVDSFEVGNTTVLVDEEVANMA